MVKASNRNSTARQRARPTDFFRGRKLIIATQHGKEEVVAPLFQPLEVMTQVATHFNSDQFGTFTGEVERKQDAIATARLKIQEALRSSGETLGLASEGSFGPHPNMGFIPADEEVVMLIDTVHQIEIVASHISTHTNYSQQEVSNWEEVKGFASAIGFPTHAVILRSPKEIRKGICSWTELQHHFDQMAAENVPLSIETDMRAMFNPTRMKVIEKATKLLIDKINSACPVCSFPAFGIVSRQAGLPCQLCNQPTSLTLSVVYQCQHCKHQSKKFFPDGENCDAMYCNHCNP